MGLVPTSPRQQAIKAGRTRYFTGCPCPQGHIAERMVSTFGCIACLADPVRKAATDKRRRLRDPQKQVRRIRAWVAANRLKALARLGNKCECCSEYQEEFLTFDHINGGGKIHRSRDTKRFYTWLVNTPLDEVKRIIRILCYNCNCAIG